MNGVYPSADDTFKLFSFGSATGSFANITNGARLSTTDNLGSFLVTLTATNLVVSDFVSPDTDGDGQTDYAESIAGTDAADPANALAITEITLNGSGHPVIRFPFVAGKNYRVLYADDPAAETWSAIDSPAFTQPAPGLHEWVDDGTLTGGLPATGRSYRIGMK